MIRVPQFFLCAGVSVVEGPGLRRRYRRHFGSEGAPADFRLLPDFFSFKRDGISGVGTA